MRHLKAMSLLATLLSCAVAARGAEDPAPAAAAPVKVDSLIAVERAAELDGRLVAYEGEAIGDAMARGGHAWINVGDGVRALGIWVPDGLLPADLGLGSWRRDGDRLAVEGVLHRACPEHGGDLDLHATALRRLEVGAPRAHPLSPARLALALASLAPAALLFALWRRKEGAARRGAPGPDAGTRRGAAGAAR